MMETLNSSGELYLTHTKVDVQVLLRMAVGSPTTTEHHLREQTASLSYVLRQ